MYGNMFDLLNRLRNIGFELINSLSSLGYNFFFKSIDEYLGISFGTLGHLTLCELFLIGGLGFWLAYKIVKWIIF